MLIASGITQGSVLISLRTKDLSLHLYQWPGGHKGVHILQVCRWDRQTGRTNWHAQGQDGHPEGPRHAGGMDGQQPYKIWRGQMKSPALGKKKPCSQWGQARHCLAGEQLCWKSPEDFGRQQAEQEPAGSPGSKASEHCPGLYAQKHSW